MGKFKPEKIRNICFAGHGRSGKTTLCEAMLYFCGATDRFGSVAEGTSVMDYDPEEIKRNFSISTTIAPAEYKDCKINMIDTPGYFDFVGEVLEAARVSDAAIIVATAKTGVQVGTELAWKIANKRDIPKIIFISKIILIFKKGLF